MTQPRKVAYCALAVLACSTVPASSCVVPLPECGVAGGGVAFLQGYDAGSVLFLEQRYEGGTTVARSVLVECSSRQAISMVEPYSWDDPYYDAYDLISEALHSEQAVTLRDLARDIRALGIEVDRITLPDGHCGCDLPEMPPPNYYCPDF